VFDTRGAKAEDVPDANRVKTLAERERWPRQAGSKAKRRVHGEPSAPAGAIRLVADSLSFAVERRFEVERVRRDFV